MQPVLIRLPNWVGDVVMALPALRHLVAQGYAPRLVGKRWAGALLAGEGWPVQARPGHFGAALRLWRSLRDSGRNDDPGFDRRPNTLLLTNSFSSAAETRLAGLRPLGYAQDGRRLLLARAITPAAGIAHESQRFLHLAEALTGAGAGAGAGATATATATAPMPPTLTIAPAARQAADRLLADLGGPPRFACLVPFATGTLAGQNKAWPGFPAFAATLARRLPVIVVPGPGEVEQARRDYPAARALEGVDLGVYAALLQRAALVVANDTGPGHLAAAVGAPLLSVLGPSDPRRHRALGPRVRVLHARPWPSLQAVEAAADAMLADRA